MNIAQKLDQLADMQAKADLIWAGWTERRDSVLTPEIKTQLQEIDIEFTAEIQVVDSVISATTAEIKAEVLERANNGTGSSFKGTRLQAVYSKGRVFWDTSKLDVYAKAYPEIAELRREGEPIVSIRTVK